MKFSIKSHHTVAKKSSKPLCESCSHAEIVRGERLRDEIINCAKLDKLVRFRVYACNIYTPFGTQPLWKMEAIAWNLLTDRKGRQIGFHSPEDTQTLINDGKAISPGDVDDE